MDTERGYLEVLFREIPYQTIQLAAYDKNTGLRPEKNSYNAIEEELFVTYASDIFPHCSIDERKQVYYTLRQEFEKDEENRKDVFVLVAELADKMLVFNEKEPRCEFSQILRWRAISFQLGQDLFTTAFLAYKDVQVGQQTPFFAWGSIIKTNNRRLENILKKGIAENHFHLNGSTQIFTLSWLCLMNNIANRSKDFNRLKKSLDHKQNYSLKDSVYGSDNRKQESLYESCMKAALYRLYLYLICNENQEYDKVREFIYSNVNHGNGSGNKTMGQTSDFIRWMEEFDEMDLLHLQNKIEVIKLEKGAVLDNSVLDYAFDKQMVGVNNNEQQLLTGERKLLYLCFLKIFQGKFGDLEKKIFYKYLIIKTKFRSELIQVNGKMGFANFNQYQDRKEIFIDNFPGYKKHLLRLAVNATLEAEEVRSLEVRVAPKDNSTEMKNKIRDTDDIITHSVGEEELFIFHDDKDQCDLRKFKDEMLERYFYVLHFIKKADNQKKSEFLPRNYNVRQKTRIQTKAIVSILEKSAKIRDRIRGIDAANSEIGCRPEVFATSFRYLQNLNINRRYKMDEEIKSIHLQATYHVGEDFLDLADGLRAIDEAILFLNFQRGNRLGHALALGIDPYSYYKCKNNIIRLSKQDMLDNVVWLLEKAKEYGISVKDGLLVMLERKFEDLFSYIYGDAIITENQWFRVNTYEYYCSWKLRGDEPNLYWLRWEEMKQKVNEKALFQYDYFSINRKIPDEIRQNEIYRKLYFYYHFNEKVKVRGKEIDELYPDTSYINLIYQIQENMIANLCDKGIAIECNPSSNYLIGTFEKYENHPILRFNSLGLEPQKKSLSVSINTDDQGVFDTYLENEYALMALALQKMKDEQGNALYNPEDVYKYIEYIRELGFEQCF